MAVQEFKGFSLFNEVEAPLVRAYNRAVTFLNIFKIHGRSQAEEYVKSFPLEERVKIKETFDRIKEVGSTTVRREVSCLVQ